MQLFELFDEAVEKKASDIHLATSESPRLRIAGELVRTDRPALDRDSFLGLMEPMLPQERRIRLLAGQSVVRTILHGEIVFVGLMFRVSEDGLAATVRLLSNDIPTIEQVGGHASDLFNEIAESRHGLVLITGPTGSGKTTTAWSLLEQINRDKADRLFVVCSHPSYRFISKKGLITQFHVGEDCESHHRALEIAFEADPDVVGMDDVPTPEALRQALILADTGHLVIANLHAVSIADTFQRLFDLSGVDVDALRRSLAHNLLAVTSQRLYRKKSGRGRVAAYESLRTSAEVKEAILTGDLNRLQQIQASDPRCLTAQQAYDTLVDLEEIDPGTSALHR